MTSTDPSLEESPQGSVPDVAPDIQTTPPVDPEAGMDVPYVAPPPITHNVESTPELLKRPEEPKGPPRFEDTLPDLGVPPMLSKDMGAPKFEDTVPEDTSPDLALKHGNPDLAVKLYQSQTPDPNLGAMFMSAGKMAGKAAIAGPKMLFNGLYNIFGTGPEGTVPSLIDNFIAPPLGFVSNTLNGAVLAATGTPLTRNAPAQQAMLATGAMMQTMKSQFDAARNHSSMLYDALLNATVNDMGKPATKDQILYKLQSDLDREQKMREVSEGNLSALFNDPTVPSHPAVGVDTAAAAKQGQMTLYPLEGAITGAALNPVASIAGEMVGDVVPMAARGAIRGTAALTGAGAEGTGWLMQNIPKHIYHGLGMYELFRGNPMTAAASIAIKHGLPPVGRALSAAGEAATTFAGNELPSAIETGISGLGKVAAGQTKGMVHLAPYAYGEGDPNAQQSVLNLGAAFGTMGAVTSGVRTGLMDSMLRTPNGPVLKFSDQPFDYQNDPYLDASHNKETSTWDAWSLQRINQARNATHGAMELYGLSPEDYVKEVGNDDSYGVKLPDGPDGRKVIYYNGEEGFRSAMMHEPGHVIFDSIDDAGQQKLASSITMFNDPTKWYNYYLGRLYPSKGLRIDDYHKLDWDKPTKIGTVDGVDKFASQKDVISEMAAEAFQHFDFTKITKDPSLMRQLQLGAARMMEAVGIPMTPLEIQSTMGVQPSAHSISMLEGVLRDVVKLNANKEHGATHEPFVPAGAEGSMTAARFTGEHPEQPNFILKPPMGLPEPAPKLALEGRKEGGGIAGLPIPMEGPKENIGLPAIVPATYIPDPAKNLPQLVHDLSSNGMGFTKTKAKAMAMAAIDQVRALNVPIEYEDLVSTALSGSVPKHVMEASMPEPPVAPAEEAPAQSELESGKTPQESSTVSKGPKVYRTEQGDLVEEGEGGERRVVPEPFKDQLSPEELAQYEKMQGLTPDERDILQRAKAQQAEERRKAGGGPPSPEKEVPEHEPPLRAPAIRTKDGQIFYGKDWTDARKKAQKEGIDLTQEITKGYTDVNGNFLDAEQAKEYAKKIGQIPPEAGGKDLRPNEWRMRNFMPKPQNPEAVKEAAIRTPDGKVWTGSWHPAAFSNMADNYSAEQLGKWANAAGNQPYYESGFVKNNGDFVSRQEGYGLAMKHGQITPRQGIAMPEAGKLEALKFNEATSGKANLSLNEIYRKSVQEIKDNGGITIDIRGHQPDLGFSFAPSKGTGTKIPIDQLSEEHLADFAAHHFAELRKSDTFLGGWDDGQGNAVLDLSNVHGDELESLVKAQAANQDAIYNLGEGKEIPVNERLRSYTPEQIRAAQEKHGIPTQAPAIGDEGAVREEGSGVSQKEWAPSPEDIRSGRALGRTGARGIWDSMQGGEEGDLLAQDLGIDKSKRYYEQKPAAKAIIDDHFRSSGQAQYMPRGYRVTVAKDKDGLYDAKVWKDGRLLYGSTGLGHDLRDDALRAGKKLAADDLRLNPSDDQARFMPKAAPETDEFKRWSGGAPVVLNSGVRQLTPEDVMNMHVVHEDGSYHVVDSSTGKRLLSNISNETLANNAIKLMAADKRPEVTSKEQAERFQTGQPVVVGAYHGSPSEEFHVFDPYSLGSYTGAPSAKQGFFFSGNKETAESYKGNLLYPIKGFSEMTRRQRDDFTMGLKEAMYDNNRETMDKQLSIGWDNDVKPYDVKGRNYAVFRKANGKNIKVQGGMTEDQAVDLARESERVLGHTNKIFTNSHDYLKEFPTFAARLGKKITGKDFSLEPTAPTLHEVYVKFKNPLVKDFKGDHYREETYNDLLKKAKAEGHDGAIFTNTYDGGGNPDNVFVTFSNKNIKSTDNMGTFDPENPNIKFMPKDHPDALKEVAFKMPDGEIRSAPVGYHSMIPLPKGYESAVDRQGIIPGYVTNKGEFLDRDKAWYRAKEQDQLYPWAGNDLSPSAEGELHSPDVKFDYMPKSRDEEPKPWASPEQFKLATQIATEAHKDQKYGQAPYINHPTELSHLVNDELKPAAMLHDVLEDSNLTKQDLLDKGIHPRTAATADALTRRPNESYGDYIQRVKQNPDARQIKILDNYSNLKTLPEDSTLRKRYVKAMNDLLVPEEELAQGLDASGHPEKSAKIGDARELPAGTPVSVRLDVPAYNATGVHVNTVHGGNRGPVMGYDNITTIDNPVFKSNEGAAERIAKGEVPKSVIAATTGEFNPSRTFPEDIGDYALGGYNPKKHAYLYEKGSLEQTGVARPIESGSRAIHQGSNVFVKDPAYGAPELHRFMPKDHPDAIKEAAIKANDGNVYTGLTHGAAEASADKAEADYGLPAVYGFVTNKGEFLDRRAALQRAYDLKQVSPDELTEAKKEVWQRKKVPDIHNLESLTFNTAMGKQIEAHYMPKAPDFEPYNPEEYLPNADFEDFKPTQGNPYPLMTVKRVKELGYKSFDISDNHSLHDYREDLHLKEDDSGQFPIDDLHKEAKRYEDLQATLWEARGEGNQYMPKNVEEMGPYVKDYMKAQPDSIPITFMKGKDGEYRFAKNQTESKKAAKLGLPPVYEAVPQTYGYDLDSTPLAKQASKGIKDEGKAREAVVSAYADKVERDAKKALDIPEVADAKGWYRVFNQKIKAKLDEMGLGDKIDKFMQLVSASSPQNEPWGNFQYAVNAWNEWRKGNYDDLIKRYHEEYAKFRNGELTLANGKPMDKVGQFERHLKDLGIRPKQASGALYGKNSDKVMHALAGTFLDTAGKLKIHQFVHNLLQEDLNATIDMWAGRTMHRLGWEDSGKKRWRMLPFQESGVQDTDFRLGQDVFKEVAKRLDLTTDDLQALMWFYEKKLWYDNKWSAKLDYGDFRHLTQYLEPEHDKGTFNYAPDIKAYRSATRGLQPYDKGTKRSNRGDQDSLSGPRQRAVAPEISGLTAGKAPLIDFDQPANVTK